MANLFQTPQHRLLIEGSAGKNELESTYNIHNEQSNEHRKLSSVSKASVMKSVPEKTINVRDMARRRSRSSKPNISQYGGKKESIIPPKTAPVEATSLNALPQSVEEIVITEIPGIRQIQSMQLNPSLLELAVRDEKPEPKRMRRSSAPNIQKLPVRMFNKKSDDVSNALSAVGIALVATNHVISMLSREAINECDESEDQVSATLQSSNTPPKTNDILNLELSRHIGIVKMLEEVNHWNLDVFELNSLSNGNSLLTLSHYVFLKSNLYARFKIDQNVFFAYMKKVQSGYFADNPYHNATHATDVLHGVNWLKDRCATATVPTELELLSLYFSAAVHDLGHVSLLFHNLISSLD